jgi:hypothetical protein
VTITTIYDADENPVELPFKWVICGRCNGHGHYNDHVYTGDEFEEAFPTDEDKDDYVNGRYDRTCESCDGSGKVKAVRTDLLTAEQLEAYEDAVEDEAVDRAAMAAEMRYCFGPMY